MAKNRQVRYAVIDDTDDSMMVIVQDGGIATCHHNGHHIITEYYHNRVNKGDVGTEEFWDRLARGKMSVRDWGDKQRWDDEVVEDMLNWLYCSTDAVGFVKCELDFKDDKAVKTFITKDNG